MEGFRGGGVLSWHSSSLLRCAPCEHALWPALPTAPLQADVPAEVRGALEVLPAERLEDVLRHAFDPPLDLQQQEPRSRL